VERGLFCYKNLALEVVKVVLSALLPLGICLKCGFSFSIHCWYFVSLADLLVICWWTVCWAHCSNQWHQGMGQTGGALKRPWMSSSMVGAMHWWTAWSLASCF
jgi:hypothetical protein